MIKQHHFLAIAFLILLLVGCALDSVSEPRRPDPATEPTLVPTLPVVAKPRFVVEKSDVIDSISFTGRVASVNESELRLAVPGTVGELFVAIGDRVNAGDMILLLDQAQLEAELTNLQAELTTLEEDRIETEKTLLNQQRLLEIAVERAQLQLAHAQETADSPPTNEQTLAIQLLTLNVEEAQLTLDLFGTAELSPNERITELEAMIEQLEAQLETAVLFAPQAGKYWRFL